MGADNFVNAEVGGKRAAKRARVLIAAKLKTPLGEVDVRLRDLSRKGALVECVQQPEVGSEVVFIRGSTQVPARVAWAAGGRIGLEFLFMIDEQEVLVQLKRRERSSGDRYRRPGLNEVMSDQERKLAVAWGVTVGLNLPGSDS
ncbi:PilZ domain-containing protein [Sphingosinicella sp. CPCC 101087]|uniref:PilZ domain-containing protein n=1 Tax=Sphingosinicella sp. CPCC 101087 TaxID=2497754 RepID=UPI00101B7138|nr:PilZ domain-containing protein [Sphingosinicella sp. CPCC 101087]